MGDPKSRYEKVRLAKAKLAANGDDPAANEAVGLCRGAVKADWTAGLPLLAKAADHPISKSGAS